MVGGSGVLLNAQNAERERIRGLARTTAQTVFMAEIARAQERWRDAREHANAALKGIASEQDDRLSNLRQSAASLAAQADAVLADLAAKERIPKQLQLFRHHRDEALYLDTRFDGLTAVNSLEATCEHARAGLNAFEAGAAGDDWTLPRLPRHADRRRAS